MTSKREQELEAAVSQSWSAEWESLPVVDLAFERSGEPAQITLRLSSGAVEALRRVADRKALSYHALARSWLADALNHPHVPSAEIQAADYWAPSDRQLNLKLDATLLDGLKVASSRIRLPYHRLGRLWLYEALAREEAIDFNGQHTSDPSLIEELLLLLHARGPQNAIDEAIRGRTRLIKLLFVVSKALDRKPTQLFYAYNYGPFSDEALDAVEALKNQGFLEGSTTQTTERPSFDDMMAIVKQKSARETSVPIFRLNPKGANAVDELLRHRPDLQAYLQTVESVKREYGRLRDDELVERVYEEFPQFTDRSLIRDEVRARQSRRKKGSR